MPTPPHPSFHPRTRDIRLDPLGAADLGTVIALQTDGGLTPWPRADFERELAVQANILLVAATVGAAVTVGAGGRRVVGFFAGRVVVDELEIFDLVVAADARRKGVGAALLGQAWRAAQGRGAARALLEVRAGNSAAIAFYRRFGFERCGVRKNYYQNPPEDAWLMGCDGCSFEL